MRADLVKRLEQAEAILRRDGWTYYADTCREAATALRALRDAPVGCVAQIAPYSIAVSFRQEDRPHGFTPRQMFALVPLDTTENRDA
jgi:hypothetical protein